MRLRRRKRTGTVWAIWWAGRNVPAQVGTAQMPSTDEMRRMASWLAECTICGVEHAERRHEWVTPRGLPRSQMGYRAQDGHGYKPRYGGGSYGCGVAEMLRRVAAGVDTVE